MALAKEANGALLTDDLQAIRMFRSEGIPVFGTLGVLQRAHALSLLDIEASLQALGATNYRHTSTLFERVILQAHQMRQNVRDDD